MRLGISAVAMLSVILTDAAAYAADAPSTLPPGVYTVKNGDKVDDNTLSGWKVWRAMACERCHGPEQEGLVGPSLVNSLKVLSKEDFHTTISHGRVEKGMPNFGGIELVQTNWENLYNYLKGRSEGKIAPGHLYPLTQTDAPPPPPGWTGAK